MRGNGAMARGNIENARKQSLDARKSRKVRETSHVMLKKFKNAQKQGHDAQKPKSCRAAVDESNSTAFNYVMKPASPITLHLK